MQLLVTARVLRTWGVSATILALPLALTIGNGLILLFPAFWPVLLTNGFDQGLRFSVDKATYELLYLPIAPGRRIHVKNAIDIVVNRLADAVGAVLLGLTTKGFLLLPGLHLGLRGTAAVNSRDHLDLDVAGVVVAVRVRADDSGQHSSPPDRYRAGHAAVTERSAADVLRRSSPRRICPRSATRWI